MTAGERVRCPWAMSRSISRASQSASTWLGGSAAYSSTPRLGGTGRVLAKLGDDCDGLVLDWRHLSNQRESQDTDPHEDLSVSVARGSSIEFAFDSEPGCWAWTSDGC